MTPGGGAAAPRLPAYWAAMKALLFAALGALPLAAQDLATLRAAARCDTAIPWMTDGFAAPDPGQPQPTLPKTTVDRAELLAAARRRAAEEKKLVFWYVPRIEGPHMIRGAAPDDYLRVVAFTDRDLAPTIARRFVPLRMAVDKALGAVVGLTAPERVEPAILLLRPDGTTHRRLDRIRTFNAEALRRWIDAALVAAGEPGVPDPLAALKATSPAEEAALEGIRRLRAADLTAAEEALRRAVEDDASTLRPRAAYALAHAVLRQGRDGEAEMIFRDLIAEHPDAPEAAQAAMNVLLRPRDTTPAGPAFHRFEDVFEPPADAFAGDEATSARPRTDADLDDVVRGAVRFLLTAQSDSGGWTDARYACCPNPRILPNVHVAVSAAALAALRDWKAFVPASAEAAVKRGEAFVFDEANLARGHNEECYADAFRLLLLARKVRDGADVDDSRARMNKIVRELARQLDRAGALAHEYPNPFATAAGAIALDAAKRAGAVVPDTLLEDCGKAVAKTRGAGGAFSYAMRGRTGAVSEVAMRNSMGRNPMCERALQIAGRGSSEDLDAAVVNFRKWLPRLERVRTCDFHTDGELGGFFFWHATYFTAESLEGLPPSTAAEHRRALRAHVLSIGEFDGAFVDSHEVGKSYGTAAALLTLARVVDRGP